MNRYRGGRRNHRRLLQDIQTGAPASAPALAPIQSPFDGCLTLMEIIDTHPNLTRLSEATADLPVVRSALSDRTFTDTFFAPPTPPSNLSPVPARRRPRGAWSSQAIRNGRAI